MAITQATQLADFTSGIGTAGAILEVDNVNNKIGIGTSNPQALLQVGQIIKMDGPSGIITATTFSGNFTGNITGNATGLSGTPNITVNNIIGVGATFTGQVTYEDVTNIDSIGIVTARSGIHVDDSITHIGDTNTKIRFPSADTFTVETSGVERFRVGSTGTVGSAGLSTATSFGAFNHLSAPFGGGTVTYTVTVASKTADHRYNGSGSGNAYLIDGVQSPFLTLTPGRTYRFTNDNTGSHPLKFYLEADKTTNYTTGVTFDNSYTEIVVSDSTPQVLHYQCTNHSLMGNAVQTNSNIGGGFNVADESSDTSCNVLFTTAATGTALAAKSGTNLTFNSSSGALTATSFVGSGANLTGVISGVELKQGGSSVGTSITAINFSGATVSAPDSVGLSTVTVTSIPTQITVADESSDTTCFPVFVTAATGDLGPKSGTNLTFNSSSGALTATSFVGAVTGDVTGNATGLTGTPNISCGTGAFSGVVTLQNNLDMQDNDQILLGTGDDLKIYHDGSQSYIGADDLRIVNNAINETMAKFIANGAVDLYYDNSSKLTTKTDGVDITGELQCDSLDVDGNSSMSGDVDFIGDSYGAVWDKSANKLKFNDNAYISLGTGSDASLYSDGSHAYFDLQSGIGNFIIRDGTTTRFTFDDAGHFTATGDLIANSDIKLKTNIQPLENSLEKVNQLRGVSYDRVDIEKDNCIGVIAQEVEEVYPEFVSEGEDGIKGVDYSKMVAVLIESVKELTEEVNTLKSQLNK